MAISTISALGCRQQSSPRDGVAVGPDVLSRRHRAKEKLELGDRVWPCSQAVLILELPLWGCWIR